MGLQDKYAPGDVLDRDTDLLERIRTGDLDDARDHLAELEHFDRRQVNRRFQPYAVGDEAWR